MAAALRRNHTNSETFPFTDALTPMVNDRHAAENICNFLEISLAMSHIFAAIPDRSQDLYKALPETVRAYGRGNMAKRLSANIFPISADTQSCLLAMADERSMAAMIKSNRRIKRNVLA